MRIKKKVLLSSIIFTSLGISNLFSDRLENEHSWEPDCEGCIKIPLEELCRGKDFEIDDIS